MHPSLNAHSPRYLHENGNPSPPAPGSGNFTPPEPSYTTDGRAYPISYPPSGQYVPNHCPIMAPYTQFSTSLPFPESQRQWSTGLCHCFDDPAVCLVTCVCPCITFGQIAEIVSKGTISCCKSGTLYGLMLVTGFACLYSCFYRSKMRGQYDLPEDPFVDCLVHFCCETCALCQEYRELRHHGFDMGIGWEGNMNRQKRGIMVPPIVTCGMRR